jgi:hypothetical protein
MMSWRSGRLRMRKAVSAIPPPLVLPAHLENFPNFDSTKVRKQRTFSRTRAMAGIKRKSEASAPTDIKSKIKKSKVEKTSSKHSTKHDVAHRPKTSKKPKPKDDSDDLMESDTSEVENGYHDFSANKEAATTSEDDDSEGDMKADSTEDSEPKKEKRSKLKPQEEYKASGLAALSGKLDSHIYYE